MALPASQAQCRVALLINLVILDTWGLQQDPGDLRMALHCGLVERDLPARVGVVDVTTTP